MWLSERERVMVLGLGGLALLGCVVQWWFRARSPLLIQQGATLPYANWEAMLQQAKQVDLNQATAEELARLPEIGPALAQRIVDYRVLHGPFRRLEALSEVPGIGPKTMEIVEDYLTVR